MLPEIQFTYYPVQVGTEEIQMRAYNTGDEKRFLIELEIKGDDITDDDIFNSLIYPCIKDCEKYNFTENQKKLLLVELRKISIGEVFEFMYSCKNPDCNKINEVEIDINNVLHYKSGDTMSDIEINGTKFEIKENNNKKRLDSIESEIEKDFAAIVLSVRSITTDKKYDSFSFDEMKAYLESLDKETFSAIAEQYYKSKDSFELSTELSCMFCGKKHHVDFDEIPGFIWKLVSSTSLQSLYNFYANMHYYGKYNHTDLDSMFPFEREIYYGMIKGFIKKENE